VLVVFVILCFHLFTSSSFGVFDRSIVLYFRRVGPASNTSAGPPYRIYYGEPALRWSHPTLDNQPRRLRLSTLVVPIVFLTASTHASSRFCSALRTTQRQSLAGSYLYLMVDHYLFVPTATSLAARQR
jgi:hypothetical protein